MSCILHEGVPNGSFRRASRPRRAIAPPTPCHRCPQGTRTHIEGHSRPRKKRPNPSPAGNPGRPNPGRPRQRRCRNNPRCHARRSPRGSDDARRRGTNRAARARRIASRLSGNCEFPANRASHSRRPRRNAAVGGRVKYPAWYIVSPTPPCRRRHTRQRRTDVELLSYKYCPTTVTTPSSKTTQKENNYKPA